MSPLHVGVCYNMDGDGMYLPYFSAKYAAILALPLKTTPPSNSNIGTIPSGVALKKRAA